MTIARPLGNLDEQLTTATTAVSSLEKIYNLPTPIVNWTKLSQHNNKKYKSLIKKLDLRVRASRNIQKIPS